MELLLENRTSNCNKHCLQLDQVATISKKASGDSQEKTCQPPSGQHKTVCLFDDQAKTVTAWLGSSDYLPVTFIGQTIPLDVRLFEALQNSLNEKLSVPWKAV